jgi:hypothetical protein
MQNSKVCNAKVEVRIVALVFQVDENKYVSYSVTYLYFIYSRMVFEVVGATHIILLPLGKCCP